MGGGSPSSKLKLDEVYEGACYNAWTMLQGLASGESWRDGRTNQSGVPDYPQREFSFHGGCSWGAKLRFLFGDYNIGLQIGLKQRNQTSSYLRGTDLRDRGFRYRRQLQRGRVVASQDGSESGHRWRPLRRRRPRSHNGGGETDRCLYEFCRLTSNIVKQPSSWW